MNWIEIIGLAVSAVWSLADGLQDGGNSITEKMYAREISNNKSNSPALKSHKQQARSENSRQWHRWGLVSYVLSAFVIALGYSGGDYRKGLLAGLILACIRFTIFNPAVAYRMGLRGWLFHLSDEPGTIDAFVRRTIGGKVAYFLAILVLFGSVYLWTLMQ